MSTAASLPPVTGRHRKHALAAARRTRAIELRTQGLTYEAIAQTLGYASRATVYAIVRKALDTHEAEEVVQFRSLETARVDRLQASLWGRAMTGDLGRGGAGPKTPRDEDSASRTAVGQGASGRWELASFAVYLFARTKYARV